MATATAPVNAAISHRHTVRRKCYARCHLSMQEYALWQYACEVSHRSGKFYLSGPKCAIEFRDTDKNTIYRLGKRLIEAGWFEVIEPRHKDPKTGLWRPAVVRPLSHEEWVKVHSSAHCHVQSMTGCGHGTVTENGHGTMTNMDASMTGNGHGSMTKIESIHDRNREQVFEVSIEEEVINLGTTNQPCTLPSSPSVKAGEEQQAGSRLRPNLDHPPIPDRPKEAGTVVTARPSSGAGDRVIRPPLSDAEFDGFCAQLYAIGRDDGINAFTGRDRDKLRQLLQTYSPDEILDAWEECVDRCSTPFERSRAVYDFCKGGAEAILQTQREDALADLAAADRRAKDEQDRLRKEREEAGANRESRIRLLALDIAYKRLRAEEQNAGLEYSEWQQKHDGNDAEFVPSDAEAFSRYKVWAGSMARLGDNPNAEVLADIAVSDRFKDVEAALAKDPVVIAAAEAKLNQTCGCHN